MSSRRVIFPLIILSAIGALVVAPVNGNPPTKRSAIQSDSAATHDLVTAANEFTLDLYRELVKDNPANLAMSGLSVHAALTMTYLGARGETADEMRRVLHLDSLIGREGAEYDILQQKLFESSSDSTYQFTLANALWTDKSYPLRNAFKETMAHCFQSETEEVSFRDTMQCENTRKRINSWTSQKTSGMIPELLQSGDLEPGMLLVLSNAVYFRGLWDTPFPNENTIHSFPFHTLDGNKTSARMMRVTTSDIAQIKKKDLKATFRGMETDCLQVLELPYCHGQASMMILLPRSANGLPMLESTLNETQLNGYLAQLEVPRGFNITIPKFRIESIKCMNQALISLGILRAFSTGADFSGIFERDQGFIKPIIHGTKADVDEQGTEASGATHIMLSVGVSAGGLKFVADHPFLFLIRDNATGVILFMGRVTNPAASTN